MGRSTPGGGHSSGGEEQGFPGTQWSTGRECRGHGGRGNVEGGRPSAGRKSCAPSRGAIHWDVCSRKVTCTVTVTGDGEIVLDLEQDDDDPDRVRLQDGAASLLGGGWRKGPPAS